MAPEGHAVRIWRARRDSVGCHQGLCCRHARSCRWSRRGNPRRQWTPPADDVWPQPSSTAVRCDDLDLGLDLVDPVRVPWITVAAMREIDRIVTDEIGLPLLRMMEHAGRGVAAVARRLLGDRVRGRRIAVLAGSGGNGGGALVAARHLAEAGAQVRLHLAIQHRDPIRATATQRRLAVAAGARMGTQQPDGDLVIDGLLGYGQSGAPRGRHAELIAAVEDTHVVAVDVPSGLELATGTRHTPCVTADVTVTLALPKRALAWHPGVVGRLVLADIGIPPSVYRRAGIPSRTVLPAGSLVEIAASLT